MGYLNSCIICQKVYVIHEHIDVCPFPSYWALVLFGTYFGPFLILILKLASIKTDKDLHERCHMAQKVLVLPRGFPVP